MQAMNSSGRAERAGSRSRAFYHGAYQTALATGEILTAIRIPTPFGGHGYAYEKLKRKVGDYATAGAAVVLLMRGAFAATCAIGLTNVADTPLFAEEASDILSGSTLDADTVK